MAGLDAPASASVRASNGVRRSDIQGLRALAVLFVLVFHAGLPAPGGFIGVDVFFVVSGFVITNMIYRERSSTGRFSVGQFYVKRFKRLTPALAVTVAVTMFMAFFLLSPFGLQETAAKTGIGAMLLGANFVIARDTGNYFAPAAESNVLLHTWSLSIEEQIYLVFPFILLLGWGLERSARRIPWAALLIGAATVASFLLTIAGADALGPRAGYYLLGYFGPLGRAWEFGVGALLALATKKRILSSATYAQLLAWIGLGLLFSSLWLITPNTTYPGVWTLLPVSGTLILIAAGTGHDTLVNRALGTSVLTKLGNWSYSIYLWHWPLIVFTKHLWPDVPFAAPAAAALSILPAATSYRWVEQPTRRLPPLGPHRTAALVGAVVLPPIVLAGTLGWAQNNYWQPQYDRTPAHQGSVGNSEYFSYLLDMSHPCRAIGENGSGEIAWSEFMQSDSRCRQSKPVSRIDIALLGDSHAEHLFTGLAEAAPNKNILYYVQNIPREHPLLKPLYFGQVFDYVVSQPSIDTVVINVGWALRGVQGEWEYLQMIFEALTATGKVVFVTDDIPEFQFDPIDCKYRIAPIFDFSRCAEKVALFEKKYAKYSHRLQDTVRKVPGVYLLNTATYFCDDQACRMNKDDTLLYRDDNHLNESGSRFLADRMLTNFPEFRAATS